MSKANTQSDTVTPSYCLFIQREKEPQMATLEPQFSVQWANWCVPWKTESSLDARLSKSAVPSATEMGSADSAHIFSVFRLMISSYVRNSIMYGSDNVLHPVYFMAARPWGRVEWGAPTPQEQSHWDCNLMKPTCSIRAFLSLVLASVTCTANGVLWACLIYSWVGQITSSSGWVAQVAWLSGV